jgi:hypothetical protein
MKAKAALQNAGGGAAGLKDRLGGAAGHAKFLCKHCGAQAPSQKQMQASALPPLCRIISFA